MKRLTSLFAATAAVVLPCAPSPAQSASRLGYQAALNQSVTAGSPLHDVSGLATITGTDTIHVSDFTYNGGGIEVFFYLATADTATAIPNGDIISPNILNNPAFIFPNATEPFGSFDLTVPATDGIDLTSPTNAYDTLSVWCVVAHADFASNNFVSVPEPAAGGVLLLGPLLLSRRRSKTSGRRDTLRHFCSKTPSPPTALA